MRKKRVIVVLSIGPLILQFPKVSTAASMDSDVSFTFKGAVPIVPNHHPGTIIEEAGKGVGAIVSGEFPQTGEAISLGILILGLTLITLGLVFLWKKKKDEKLEVKS